MIEAVNIFKSYGDVKVLKGINITINKGEIVSVVGSSGAGKTTLLQIIGTLSNPDEGSVIINETEVSLLNQKKLARFRNKNIGFVFQFHQLLPEFSALENVCIPAYIAGTAKRKAEERGKELLDYLGLDHRLEHKPNELSGGEKQRVAIARALINDPMVIFADEPTGNLDSQNTNELYELITQLRNQFQQTFVIVTHNTEVANTSDKMFTIKDGIIVQ